MAGVSDALVRHNAIALNAILSPLQPPGQKSSKYATSVQKSSSVRDSSYFRRVRPQQRISELDDTEAQGQRLRRMAYVVRVILQGNLDGLAMI